MTIIAAEFLGCYWSPENLKALKKVLISGLAALKKGTLSDEEKSIIASTTQHLDEIINEHENYHNTIKTMVSLLNTER